MAARQEHYEKYKKPAPTGYLIHVNSSSSVRPDGEHTTTHTSKIPVADLAGATIKIAERMKGESLTRQCEIMKLWLQSIANHKSPTANHKIGSRTVETTDEFWFEPFTEEQKAEIEEGGGVGVRSNKGRCPKCREYKDACYCDEEEDED